MTRLFIAVAIGATLISGAANGQTAIQAGLWEVTETLERGKPVPTPSPAPTPSRGTCIKGDNAILETLLYPSEAFTIMLAMGCTFTPGPKHPSILKAALACPATKGAPATTFEAEVSYTPDSYEGRNQVTAKDKAGTKVQVESIVVSGKRVGDC